MSEFGEVEPRRLPWKDVEACRRNARLQRRHPAPAPSDRQGRACPGCGTPASELTWVYFRSPDQTWMDLCGTEGFLVICDECHKQVDYFEEALS